MVPETNRKVLQVPNLENSLDKKYSRKAGTRCRLPQPHIHKHDQCRLIFHPGQRCRHFLGISIRHCRNPSHKTCKRMPRTLQLASLVRRPGRLRPRHHLPHTKHKVCRLYHIHIWRGGSQRQHIGILGLASSVAYSSIRVPSLCGFWSRKQQLQIFQQSH